MVERAEELGNLDKFICSFIESPKIVSRLLPTLSHQPILLIFDVLFLASAYLYKSGTGSDAPVPRDPTRTKPPGNFKMLPNHNKKR